MSGANCISVYKSIVCEWIDKHTALKRERDELEKDNRLASITYNNPLKLTAQHEKAIDLLLDGTQPPDIAQQLQVSKVTVYRWLKEPEFTAELYQRRREMRRAIINRLHTDAQTAIDTLRDVMTNPRASAMARINAASKVLDIVMEQTENEEIQQRIAELEQCIVQLTSGQPPITPSA